MLLVHVLWFWLISTILYAHFPLVIAHSHLRRRGYPATKHTILNTLIAKRARTSSAITAIISTSTVTLTTASSPVQTLSTSTTTPVSNSAPHGTPPSALAGIVIGIICFAGLTLLALFLHHRKKVQKQRKAVPFAPVTTISLSNPAAMGFSFAYLKDEDAKSEGTDTPPSQKPTFDPSLMLRARDRNLPPIPEQNSRENSPATANFGYIPTPPPAILSIASPRQSIHVRTRNLPVPPTASTSTSMTAPSSASTEESFYSRPSPASTQRGNSIRKPRAYTDQPEKKDKEIPQSALEEIARLRAENTWLREHNKIWENDEAPPQYRH